MRRLGVDLTPTVNLTRDTPVQRRETHGRRGRLLGYSDSAVKLRVTDGSTGIPGPVVVDTVTFFR